MIQSWRLFVGPGDAVRHGSSHGWCPRHWTTARPTHRRSLQAAAKQNRVGQSPGSVDAADVTDIYFQGYSRIEIHEAMLRDKPRTEAYRKAIMKNAALFEGKTVLDVGCGTGVLSLFAAKAGAEHVYGVDASLMAYKAQQIVRDNGFKNEVTIIHGKVEEVQLPIDKVDIIISEWMGYFLLYESMLDSVLYARDKWLAPGGAMLPDQATLFLVGLQDPEYKQRKLEFWQDVYGLNMRAMKPLVISTAHLATVKPDRLVTSAASLLHLSLTDMQLADSEFSVPFELAAVQDCTVNALVAYFTVDFASGPRAVVLSTAPKADRTHWQQTVLCLPDDVDMQKGEVLRGELHCRKNALQQRWLDIRVQFRFKGVRGTRKADHTYYLH